MDLNANKDIELEEVSFSKPVFSEDENKEELYLYTLKHLAYANSQKRDNLTEMRGLSSFFYTANEMILENPEHYYGMIVMDITQFKAVNEFCGRKAGDEFLIFLSDTLKKYEQERPLTVCCHVRADNFCLCTAFENASELSDICKEMVQLIRDYPLPYHPHPSFGICASDEYKPEASTLKDRATIALARIKGKFYADYKFFDFSMRDKIFRERQIENEILAAIDKNEIVPFIQPKVDMRSGEIIGGEALVRWVSKEKGIIPPGQFIPPLEENGFIITLDKLIWRKIFEFQKSRIDRGLKIVPISVNLSRVHVYDDDLIDTLVNLQKEYEVDPGYIWIELTESAMVDDTAEIFRKVEKLQSKGFYLSMDDFGTGYSSLFMLKKQPVDEVKMDREFILELDKPDSVVILKNVAAMLKGLGKKIIVEGVETEEQKSILLENGLYAGQGFYFYKPMPAEEFDKLF